MHRSHNQDSSGLCHKAMVGLQPLNPGPLRSHPGCKWGTHYRVRRSKSTRPTLVTPGASRRSGDYHRMLVPDGVGVCCGALAVVIAIDCQATVYPIWRLSSDCSRRINGGGKATSIVRFCVTRHLSNSWGGSQGSQFPDGRSYDPCAKQDPPVFGIFFEPFQHTCAPSGAAG